MSETINSITNIPAPFNMIVLVVLIGAVATVLGTVVSQVRQYASHRQELEFKRDLLERGMSAEEIERVVKVRGSGVDR